MRSQGVLIEKRACVTCNYFSYAYEACLYGEKSRVLKEKEMLEGCDNHDPWLNAKHCPKCGSDVLFPLRTSIGSKKIKCMACFIMFSPILYSGG